MYTGNPKFPGLPQNPSPELSPSEETLCSLLFQSSSSRATNLILDKNKIKA